MACRKKKGEEETRDGNGPANLQALGGNSPTDFFFFGVILMTRKARTDEKSGLICRRPVVTVRLKRF